jgi:N-methylhydantoinase A
LTVEAGIAVDIGGTFTDIVLSRTDGAVFVHKVSSTTHEPERAVVAGIAAILAHAGVAPEAVGEILHGTTVGSNAILQRAGARTGLITTRGFRDVLEIGRVRTPELYDLAWDKPAPLVRRRHRLEVGERIGAGADHPRRPWRSSRRRHPPRRCRSPAPSRDSRRP